MSDILDCNVDSVISDRGIKEVLHFTTENGLTGCCASNFVLSRAGLNADKYLSFIASPVSKERKEAESTFNKDENWLDYVNLSVSEINSHYYNAARNWFKGEGAWWCILAFNPDILGHDKVYFATTNNIYTSVRRTKGAPGLKALFSSQIERWNRNVIVRRGREKHLPTCEQAEVLYPNKLSMQYLMKVYALNEEQASSINGTLKCFGFYDVDVIIDANKFNGVPNT